MRKVLRFAAVALAVTTMLAESDHRKQKPMVRVTFKGYQTTDSAFTGKHIDPTLEIYKDGFVRVLRFYGDESTKWAIEHDAMKRFRSFLRGVDWRDFSAKRINDAVYKAMSARRAFPLLDHDATVTIEIHDGSLHQLVSFRGIDWIPDDYPEVTELQTLRRIIEQIYLAAGEGVDGYAAPPVGKRHLHEQFVAIGARMSEPEPISNDEFYQRARPFKFQLKELGDEQFAAALAKENSEVIAAVSAVFEPKDLADCPRTSAVIDAIPKVKFPARRMTLVEENEISRKSLEQLKGK